jgi:uncharacterized protein YceK
MGKSLIVLMAAVAMAGCASVQTPAPDAAGGGRTLHVPPAREAQCMQQGGCGLVTAHEIQQALQQAFDMGAAAGQQSCRRGRDS